MRIDEYKWEQMRTNENRWEQMRTNENRIHVYENMRETNPTIFRQMRKEYDCVQLNENKNTTVFKQPRKEHDYIQINVIKIRLSSSVWKKIRLDSNKWEMNTTVIIRVNSIWWYDCIQTLRFSKKSDNSLRVTFAK